MRLRTLTVLLTSSLALAQQFDERTGAPGEWGFRPAEGTMQARNPPPFCWRPQRGAHTYALQVASDERFENVVYEATDIEFNVHCPTTTLTPGDWWWRIRSRAADDDSD